MGKFVSAPGLLPAEGVTIIGQEVERVADIVEYCGVKGRWESDQITVAIDWPSMQANPDAIWMPVPVGQPWGWLRGTLEMLQDGVEKWREDAASLIQWCEDNNQHPHMGYKLSLVREISKANQRNIALVMDALADDLSRATLEAITQCDFAKLVPIYEERVFTKVQYFEGIELIPPHNLEEAGDHVLNIGVHDGWDLPYWIAMDADFVSVDPMEPRLGAYVRPFVHDHQSPLHIIAMDSYTGKCVLPATDDGQALGAFNGTETEWPFIEHECVSLDRFDTVFGDFSVIKMDTEGAEQNILWGGLNSLRNNRPVMAISIYHQVADFWGIALWIMRHLGDYRLYIRPYSFNGAETILYAIPEERDIPKGLKETNDG